MDPSWTSEADLSRRASAASPEAERSVVEGISLIRREFETPAAMFARFRSRRNLPQVPSVFLFKRAHVEARIFVRRLCSCPRKQTARKVENWKIGSSASNVKRCEKIAIGKAACSARSF